MSGERGSMPIVLAAIVVVLAVAVSAVMLGVIAVAKARAEGAADLAALAAVTRGCDGASAIAAANGARLASCTQLDDSVRVTVALPMPVRHAWLGRIAPGIADEVTGTARAGLGLPSG